MTFILILLCIYKSRQMAAIMNLVTFNYSLSLRSFSGWRPGQDLLLWLVLVLVWLLGHGVVRDVHWEGSHHHPE
mgnify:FL=1